MPHYFTASREPIQLDESPNDIGLRFGGEVGAASAKVASRFIADAASSRRAGPRASASRFGRFMLFHDRGVAMAPVQGIVNALPRKLAAGVARTLPVFVERESQLRLVATEQILVAFIPSSSASRRRKLLDGLGLAVAGESEFDRGRKILVPTSVRRASRALDLANRLVEADDVVAFAAPNFLAEVRKHAVAERYPLFRTQWHLENTGQNGAKVAQDVRARGAWVRAGGGSRSVAIAIIDDGVDLEHPDLKANLWRNPSRRARDRHGRDFVDDANPYDPRPKVFSAPFDDTDTNDIHGTPCAGVAAAVGKRVAGVAWSCRLLAVKMMAGVSLAPNDRIGDAIRYAAKHADVLSCSWEVARHPDIESAIRFAVERGRSGRGAVMFAATGNEYKARIGFPASDPRVIAVGACNDRGVRSKYSNFGSGIDLVAPSDDDHRPGIATTDVSLRGKGYGAGGYCDDFGGTSSATPLAAGVAALVLSASRSLLEPEVRKILTSTADKIDTAKGGYRKGYSLRYGFGRVNADAAVAAALRLRARRKRASRRAKR